MHQQTQQFADTCIDAAEKAASSEGFVPVRKLIDFFNAEIIAQPLLYEGMIAEPKSGDAKWIVLLDSESSGYTPDRYTNESSSSPLPVRVRFTIAHELTHVIQLRSGHTLLKAPSRKRRKGAPAIEVNLEREADALSPLLLIPDTNFAERLINPNTRLSLTTLNEARKYWAVSRETLVNRLGLLIGYDPKSFRYKLALKDIAVGVAEWSTPRTAQVCSWPRVFNNFSGGLVPEFLQPAGNDSTETLNTIFASQNFVLNGGTISEAEAEVFTGTKANPRCEKMRVKLTVEVVKPAAGSKFLFIAERV